MTLPVSRKPLGARHPLPKLMEDVEDFFISMGCRSPPARKSKPNGTTSTP